MKIARLHTLVSALAALAVVGNSLHGATWTFTSDADFDGGVLFNVNHDNPNNDQLQLSGQSATFPVLWVANAGEDTLSKIDTNTGRETGRYRTWFSTGLHSEFAGPAPSRTAVDASGNCFVANRHFDGRPASVVKILASGGIDRNGNGIIDTSVDANNNGVIDPAEIMPITDSNANAIVDPSEITDERVAWILQIGPNSGLGRSLTIAPDGSVWLGLYSSQVYYKLNPTTGAVLAGPINVSPVTPYGAVVDVTGTLWGASLSTRLLKLDTNTNTMLASYADSYSNYGIGFGNGKVYLGQANPVREFNPLTNTFNHIGGVALGFTAYGVSVASNGEILVHGAPGSSYGGATRIRPDGSIRWFSFNQPGAGDFEGRGCMPDANDDVWTVNLNTSNVQKYRGSDGAPLGVFPVGYRPYSYSDATGSTFVQTIGLGRWTVLIDTGMAGTDDCVIGWNATIPTGANLAVAIGASDSGDEIGDYNPASFVPVANGATAPVSGRYHVIQVSMTPDPASNASPVLFDLTAICPDPCGQFDLNDDGCVDRTDLNLEMVAVRAGNQDVRYDMNCDGRVNVADGRFLALRFTNPGGTPCQ